jgi:lipoate-protein ligase A
MNSVLKKPPNDNVSTICRETNQIFTIDQAKEILKKEFEVTFDTGFEKTEISIYELELIKKLLKDRYHNDNWNYLR